MTSIQTGRAGGERRVTSPVPTKAPPRQVQSRPQPSQTRETSKEKKNVRSKAATAVTQHVPAKAFKVPPTRVPEAPVNDRVSDEAVAEKESDVADNVNSGSPPRSPVLAARFSQPLPCHRQMETSRGGLRVSQRLAKEAMQRVSVSPQEKGNSGDGGDHPLVPGLKNWSNAEERRINQERFRKASRGTRLQEVQDEAILAHPDAFPDAPPEIVSKPSMFHLIENGLLDDNAWQNLGLEDLVALGQSLESDPQQKLKFAAACTAYTCSMSAEEFGRSKFRTVVDEIKRVQTKPYDADVSAEKWRHVWHYAQYKRLELEWQTELARRNKAVEELRAMFIDEAMIKWDLEWGYNLEKSLWWRSPLFAYCATNPLIAESLPYMPWTHSESEAEDVVARITSRRTPRLPITAETMYLKLCVVASGKLTR